MSFLTPKERDALEEAATSLDEAACCTYEGSERDEMMEWIEAKEEKAATLRSLLVRDEADTGEVVEL